jgi:hypothetical protein
MDKQELVSFFEAKTKLIVSTMKAKNEDYAGTGLDPFANFTRVEVLGICRTEQGFLTRMTDKLCRITSFAQNGQLQVKTESVHDTLLDLATYALLMSAYLEATHGEPGKPSTVDKPIDVSFPPPAEPDTLYGKPRPPFKACIHQKRSFNIVNSEYHCDDCGVKLG